MFGRMTILILFAVSFVLCGPAVPAVLPPAAVHAAQAEHGGEASEDELSEALNPLDFQTDLALWTGVVFIGVLIVLWKFAWKPLAEALDAREKHIANEIEHAEQARREAKEALEQYQRKLAEAENEIRQMLDKARQEADATGHKILEKARQEAEQEHQRKLAEIEEAADNAVKEVAQRAGSLAVELAGRIITARLDPAAHARLIEQAVEGLDKANGSSEN